MATRSCEGCQFAAAGDTATISVTVPGSVSWDVADLPDWLSVSGSSSWVGSGSVTLVATPNDSIGIRSEVIKLAGRDFNVSQLGRNFSVSCESTAFDVYSDYGDIDIDTDGDIEWSAESSESWLKFYNTNSQYADGIGSDTLLFTVDEYVGDGSPRTATVTIGEEEIYITQSAYSVSVNPSSALVSGNNGQGEISVSASSEEVWNSLQVLCSKDWITSVIASTYDPANKRGTFIYTYTANDTGVARSCVISFNGEQYALQQAARVVVSIDAAVVGHGTVSGIGERTQGEKVSLTAVPDAGYEFAYWDDPDGVRKEQNPLSVTADVAKSVTAHFTPMTPEFLSVVSSTNGVKLVWTNLAWAAEYRIYRAPSSEIPANPLVIMPSGGECEYLDESGELEKPYWYWIEAIGAEDEDPTTTISQIAGGGRRVKAIIISSIVYENLKGASHTNPATYQEGNSYVFTAPGSIEGYVFAGWSPVSILTNLTGDLTVTANWTPISYRLHYNANGGNGTMANTECSYDIDAVVAANGFTREGYDFLGWGTSADGEVVYSEGEIVKNLTSRQGGLVELYAIWKLDEASVVCAEPVITPANGSSFTGESQLVTITCETEGAAIYFSTNGVTPKTSSGNLYTGPITIRDTTTVIAIAVYTRSDDTKSKSGYVTATISKVVITLADAVDAPSLVFTTGGAAECQPVVDENAKVGTMCARSGAIGDSETSWLETTVTGAGEFSFWWKTRCEDDELFDNWDHLKVYTNGVAAAVIDGENDWTQVRFTFGEGEHTIRWAYEKDESDEDPIEGGDCAWLDGVVWTPAAAPPPSTQRTPQT